MTRVGAVLLAAVGLLLAAAGMFVALAVGLPALGLNPYGRNPLTFTIEGLGSALTLYAVGAAVVAGAFRWVRDYGGGAPRASRFWSAGLIALLVCGWMGSFRSWIYVLIVPLFAIGLLAPVAVGLWPKARRPTTSLPS